MDDVQEQLEQARVLERTGKEAAALKQYAEVAERAGPHRDDPGFWTRLGRLRQRAGQGEAAAESLERAVELLLRAGQANSAIALCRRILRADPSREEVWLRHGELALEQELPVDAREALVGYADRMAERGEPEEAIHALRRLRERFPRDPDGRRALAARLREAGRDGEATEELRGLWALLRQEGKAEKAAEVREEILALSPEADPEVVPVEEPEVEEAPGAEDLPFLAGDAGLPRVGEGPTERVREPGLQPTSLAEASLADPFADAEGMEGLEPTAAEPVRPPESDLPLVETSLLDPTLGGLDDGAVEPREETVGREMGETPVREPRAAAPPPDDGYVDLGALVLGDDDEEDTRFRVEREDPSGDEDQDFADILALFRQQVSEHIAADDTASHYDLGLAFKDMGLLDDAIGQLQMALRAGANPLATLEVMGECFLEKNEPSLAARVLNRATRLQGAADVEMVGVYYLLARCEEALGRPEEARGCYERVVSVDIAFRDAATRLEALRNAGRSV